jgi:hypothetical protein
VKKWTHLGHPHTGDFRYEPKSITAWLQELRIKRWEHYAEVQHAQWLPGATGRTVLPAR